MTNLSTALNDPAIKNEATSIIRSLLSEIRLIPEDGELAIEPVGELAGLLALSGSKNDESCRVAACSTVMVAGQDLAYSEQLLIYDHLPTLLAVEERSIIDGQTATIRSNRHNSKDSWKVIGIYGTLTSC